MKFALVTCSRRTEIPAEAGFSIWSLNHYPQNLGNHRRPAMLDLTNAQKARVAIRSFTTIVDALALRGFYRPFDRFGQSLAECLMNLSPEIYGSMKDPRVVEIKGLEYAIDRLPRGIEESSRIILTEEEHFGDSSFEKIIPLKRRRTCYRVSEKEMCFIITRGLSEIYDIIAHLTFMYIESHKIHSRMKDESGNITIEWKNLEQTVLNFESLDERQLDQAILNLSIIIGRSYRQTRKSFDYFENNRRTNQSNNGLFSLIYRLGLRLDQELQSSDNAAVIYLTPSLMNIIGHQQYGVKWAADIKAELVKLGLAQRPIHIISANMHSVSNILYGFAAIQESCSQVDCADLYQFIQRIRDNRQEVLKFARRHGLYELKDSSGTNIDCQLIDTAKISDVVFHPQLNFDHLKTVDPPPVILIMDYAFGMQAFEVMDRLLNPLSEVDGDANLLNLKSVSVMGKAGILTGGKGDIMLATAHVIEGSADNYMFDNDLGREDFDNDIDVYVGPMITVVGTSLQNKDILEYFLTSWKTIGLEMEGGHYQRAISAAVIKGHKSRDVKVRYAYYASDNPLQSGQTLAEGPMGDEGIKPTYMITKVILEKIFGFEKKRK